MDKIGEELVCAYLNELSSFFSLRWVHGFEIKFSQRTAILLKNYITFETVIVYLV